MSDTLCMRDVRPHKYIEDEFYPVRVNYTTFVVKCSKSHEFSWYKMSDGEVEMERLWR
jgi:hypothetical protein